jgi:hypothetical protein
LRQVALLRRLANRRLQGWIGELIVNKITSNQAKRLRTYELLGYEVGFSDSP